jgi:hypothetical protein
MMMMKKKKKKKKKRAKETWNNGDVFGTCTETLIPFWEPCDKP